MELSKLKEHYHSLKKFYKDYSSHEFEANSARRKPDRDRAKKRADSVRERFESYVIRNGELYDFLTKNKGDAMGRHFHWDELKSWQYFGKDLPKILKEMEGLISESE